MASTNFIDNSTVIIAAWLNDINGVAYSILGDGVSVPTTAADARTNLGVPSLTGVGTSGTWPISVTGTAASATTAVNVSGTVAIANGGTGSTTAATARTALGSTTVGDAVYIAANAAAARTAIGTVIGTDVQAYDATLAKTGVAQTYTLAQRGTVTTDNDLSFDMNVTNNFKCTPSAGGTLAFTNITSGQSGNIYLVNGSNYAIAKNSYILASSTFLTTISATGNYWVSYYSPDGTNVVMTASAAVS